MLGADVVGSEVVGVPVGFAVGTNVSPMLVGASVVGSGVVGIIVGSRVVGAGVGAWFGEGVGWELGRSTLQQAVAQRWFNSTSRTCALVAGMYVQQLPSTAAALQVVSESMLGPHDGAWVGFVDGARVGSAVVGAAVVGSEVAGATDGAGVGSLVAGIEVGTLVVG